MNINIKTFDDWALSRKDIKMEKGHTKSVDKMISIIKKKSEIINNKFSFLDLGCGNGWVVRKILKNNNCINAVGIDGSPNMIKIANEYQNGNFHQERIENIKFNKKYDIIFSMETFYYLDDIQDVLTNIYKNGIRKNGMIIIGIDHYLENEPTLSWDTDYNLSTKTYGIKKWLSLFKLSGFKNTKHMIFGKNKDWHGTLIIFAVKN